MCECESSRDWGKWCEEMCDERGMRGGCAKGVWERCGVVESERSYGSGIEEEKSECMWEGGANVEGERGSGVCLAASRMSAGQWARMNVSDERGEEMCEGRRERLYGR